MVPGGAQAPGGTRVVDLDYPLFEWGVRQLDLAANKAAAHGGRI
jgi:hypothetical protein